MFVGIGLIASGNAEAVIAGGVESMSDVPIRFSRQMRKFMIKQQKVRWALLNRVTEFNFTKVLAMIGY